VARQLAEEGLKSLIKSSSGEESIARAVEAASGGTAENI